MIEEGIELEDSHTNAVAVHSQHANKLHYAEFLCDDVPLPTLYVANNSPYTVMG
jgi:hypothetical protein